jgi:hypothetical protein
VRHCFRRCQNAFLKERPFVSNVFSKYSFIYADKSIYHVFTAVEKNRRTEKQKKKEIETKIETEIETKKKESKKERKDIKMKKVREKRKNAKT